MRVQKISIIIFLVLCVSPQMILSQDTLSVRRSARQERKERKQDDIILSDSMAIKDLREETGRKRAAADLAKEDTSGVAAKPKVKKTGDPMKAAMLSAVLPGGGQILNGKYWKVPVVYAGFGALIYYFSSNANSYQLYYKGYQDFTDDIKETSSYIDFVPLKQSAYDPVNYPDTYSPANAQLVKERMLRLIDYHKRYRDLSIILTGVWYMAQILDANVDASLLNYDISDNLELTFHPSMITLPGKAPASAFNIHLTMVF